MQNFLDGRHEAARCDWRLFLDGCHEAAIEARRPQATTLVEGLWRPCRDSAGTMGHMETAPLLPTTMRVLFSWRAHAKPLIHLSALVSRFPFGVI